MKSNFSFSLVFKVRFDSRDCLFSLRFRRENDLQTRLGNMMINNKETHFHLKIGNGVLKIYYICSSTRFP